MHIAVYCCVDEMGILIRWDLRNHGVAVGDAVEGMAKCGGNFGSGVGAGDFMDEQRHGEHYYSLDGGRINSNVQSMYLRNIVKCSRLNSQ